MIERLTVRIKGKAFYDNNGNPLIPAEILDTPFVRQALNRLAAYEDSGLSPEQVQELAKAAEAEKALEEVGTSENNSR